MIDYRATIPATATALATHWNSLLHGGPMVAYSPRPHTTAHRVVEQAQSRARGRQAMPGVVRVVAIDAAGDELVEVATFTVD